MKRMRESDLTRWQTAAGRKPLILLGARQVGKTYILRVFAARNFTNSVYLNFESDKGLHRVFDQDLDAQRIINDLRKLGHEIQIGKTLLIFDEIQNCESALTSLKYFCEGIPELHVCAAGSLLGLQLAEGSFPVGKVDLMSLYPMTFLEFLHGIGDLSLYDYLLSVQDGSSNWSEVMHPRVFARFKDYLIIGGLPEVVAEFAKNLDQVSTAYEVARKKQESLIFQYVADIAKHSGKVNSMHIERVWSNAASQLATTHDGKSDKFKFKGVVPNIRGYERLAGAIEWLQKAGLIVKVPICKKPASPLRGYTEDSVFKIYLFDVGILGAMIGLRPSTVVAYDFGSYKGYLAENFVTRELVSQGIELYCWRESTSEVDFLIEDDTGIIPIEVKSGQSNQAKSLGVYIKKYQPRHIVKLSGRCPDRRSVSDGYEHLPLYGINVMHHRRD